jgi:hypothetical protein
MVEVVAERPFHQPRGLGVGQLVLGLALEVRVSDKYREHPGHAAEQVLGGQVGRALLLLQLAVGAQALHQRRAQPRSWVPPWGVGMVLA